jgi:hypothetical protein
MGPSKKGKKPARYKELVAEVTEAMTARADDPQVRSLWVRVRKVAKWRNPTQLEIITAFLPEH